MGIHHMNEQVIIQKISLIEHPFFWIQLKKSSIWKLIKRKHGEKTLEVIQSQKKSFKVKKSHFKSKKVMKSQYPNTKLYIALKKKKANRK